MRAGKNVVQPDKAASFAAELVVLYKITGRRKYLDATVRIADTLAARIKPGDAENSPWPYRVNATTDEVHKETRRNQTSIASYTSNYTGALRLFNDLTALKAGNAKAYTRARYSRRLAQGISHQDQQVGPVLRGHPHHRLVGHRN